MFTQMVNIPSAIMTILVINRSLIFHLIIFYSLSFKLVSSVDISSNQMKQTYKNSSKRIITSLKPHCNSGDKCNIRNPDERISRQDFLDSDENIIKTIANVLESDELITALARVPLWITTISAINRAVNDAINGTNTPSLGSFFIQQGSDAVKFFQGIAGVVSSIPGGGSRPAVPVYPGQLFRPKPQVSVVTQPIVTENPAYSQVKPAVGRPGYDRYPGIAPNKEAASGVFAGSVGYLPVDTFPDELSHPTYPTRPQARPQPQYQPIKVTSPPIQVQPIQPQIQSNSILEVDHGWIQSPDLVENIFDTLNNLDTNNYNVAPTVTQRPFQPNSVVEPEVDSFLEYLEREYLSQQSNLNHYGNSLKKGARETTTQKVYFTERPSALPPFRLRPTATITPKRPVEEPFTFRPMPSRDMYLSHSTRAPYRPMPSTSSYVTQSTPFPFRPRPTQATPKPISQQQPLVNTNHVHIHINFLPRPDLGNGTYQANYKVHPENFSEKFPSKSETDKPSFSMYKSKASDTEATMIHVDIDIPKWTKSDRESAEIFTRNGNPSFLRTTKAPNISQNNFKANKFNKFNKYTTTTTGKPVYWMNMYYPNGFPGKKVKSK